MSFGQAEAGWPSVSGASPLSVVSVISCLKSSESHYLLRPFANRNIERPKMEQPPRTHGLKSLKGSGDALLLEWDDGLTHRLSWRLLRDRCPCATCLTKEDVPKPSTGLLTVLDPREAQPLKVL